MNPSDKVVSEEEQTYLNSDITQYIGMLFNHARHYVKTATKQTPLVGWNDLVAMVVLFYGGSMRKTELIQRCLIELSPGIEVLKRLLRQGLVEEFDDVADGRAKQVNLTQSGKKLYQEIEARMEKVGQIVAGNLSLDEKRQLVPLLHKLINFHQPIFEEDLGKDLEVILEKWVREDKGERRM
ncbi:MAG: winged helix DNA-binding protein [Saprospiraceae bacterium]|nr:winged helix DNA-binding protein [Saprospiraceae bacterium]